MPFRHFGFRFVRTALVVAIAGGAFLPAAGQDQDRGESKQQIYGGYSFFAPNAKFSGTPLNSAHGFLFSATEFFNRNVGLEIASGGNYGNNVNIGTIQGGLVGRFFFSEATPFVHADVGLTRVSPAGLSSKWGISLTAGAGWDLPLYKSLDLRLFQADLVYSHLNYSSIGTRLNPESMRLSTGLVWNFSGHSGKTPAASIACTASPTEVFAGDPVQVTTEASGFKSHDTITYSWSATGGSVGGNSPSASVDTKGLGFGNYLVKAHATDSKGTAAECTAQFVVKEQPAH